MLCGIPADTVNAHILQLIYKALDHLLNVFMLGVDVLHADITVSYLITVLIANDRSKIVPILIGCKILLDIVVISRKMIGNNVNDHLDAVTLGSVTKLLELLSGTEISVLSYLEGSRLIEPIPGTCSLCRLNR